MYPFGSGMPQQTPPQQHNNPNVPFGAGCWANPNQSPYPNQTQPQSQAPYPSFPAQSSYPSSQQPAAYPSHGSAYPSSQNMYPPQTPYPSNQMPYPGSHQQAPYPGSQPTGYPGQMQNSPYPAAATSSYPPSSTTASSYPNQSQYPSHSPYPQTQHSMYPTNTPYGSAAYNMTQSYSEPRGHSPNINKGTPTVLPAQNFDPIKDAHDLRKAMKGFGTDEDALINIICRRSNAQRQEIQRQYKTNFGKDLIEDIKSETSGNFEKLLVGLLHPIDEFYCMEICDAMSGLGTDEDVLIETLCTLSNSEIHTIKKTYLRMYGAHLESELKSETSGHFKRLLVSLCAAARDESGRVDPAGAVNDARELLNAGELRIGTDESLFNMVLCQRNYQQLKLIFKEYENLTGHTLEKAIKREFSGDIMEGLLAIYKCVTNKSEFFATRLHKSMAGIGTNDKQLIRIIITRCEIDMQDIKNEFEKMYGKSLRSWIKGDTSGHYKHALYALIGENRSS